MLDNSFLVTTKNLKSCALLPVFDELLSMELLGLLAVPQLIYAYS